jgi:hypothetical protein
MRWFIFAAALCCASAAANAQYVTAQSLPPCDANRDGNLIIVQRPPTTEEFAAQDGRGPSAPPLLLMSDYVTCNGATGNYELSASSFIFRGGSQ